MGITYEMETDVCRLARDLPEEYVKRMAVEWGEIVAPDDEVPDIPVTIEYVGGWFQAGNRRGHPDNWEPDDGENPEIVTIRIEGNDALDITDAFTPQELRDLENRCWEDQQRRADDYY